VLSIQESIVNHVEYTLARTRHHIDDFECYQAAAFSLRDRLIEMWNDTQTYFKCVRARARVCGHASMDAMRASLAEQLACSALGCCCCRWPATLP
jgi:hypothetical protein